MASLQCVAIHDSALELARFSLDIVCHQEKFWRDSQRMFNLTKMAGLAENYNTYVPSCV